MSSRLEHGRPIEGERDEVFPFVLPEKELIARLNAAVRMRMLTADPSTLNRLSAFLFALERLPLPTADMWRHVYVTPKPVDRYAYLGVVLESDEFTLYVAAASGDGSELAIEEEIAFEARIDGMRLESDTSFSEWLDAFEATTAPIRVEGDGAVDMTGLPPRGRWDLVAEQWDSHGEFDHD